MDPKEILNLCLKNGILLDSETLKIVSNESEDLESVMLILERIKTYTNSRVITKNLLQDNKDKAKEFFLTLPEENQRRLEKLKIKLGLQIEISKEITTPSPTGTDQSYEDSPVKVLSKIPSLSKKIGVSDFTKILRDRFVKLRGILQDHSELDGLVSIDKLSGNRRHVSIMGILSDKRMTKNKNLLFEIEDLTGRIRVLINNNKPDLFTEAEELPLDSVIGFSGSGDREIFFADKIVFPDSMLPEKKKSPFDESVAFISDLQYGSNLFFEKEFDKFIDYLNGKGGNSAESGKIKYLFVGGDVVSGVGVYPGQIKDLEIKNLEEQYQGIADLFSKIRKNIKIIFSPGNHDGVRLMEPQPVLDEKYAWPLYNLKNAIFTGNPAYTNIGAKRNFQGFDILTYHGFSYPYFANNIPSLIKETQNNPGAIMAYLLKYRHLSPTFGSIQTLPAAEDEMVIDKIPDIFVSGHLHKNQISFYKNILLIANGTWEGETEHEKKRGINPDVCKVPLFNMKTRSIKILDFETPETRNGNRTVL